MSDIKNSLGTQLERRGTAAGKAARRPREPHTEAWGQSLPDQGSPAGQTSPAILTAHSFATRSLP
jgi:hypothetical protein